MNGESSGDPAGQHERCSRREQPEDLEEKALLDVPQEEGRTAKKPPKNPKLSTKVQDLEKKILEQTERKLQEHQSLKRRELKHIHERVQQL